MSTGSDETRVETAFRKMGKSRKAVDVRLINCRGNHKRSTMWEGSVKNDLAGVDTDQSEETNAEKSSCLAIL